MTDYSDQRLSTAGKRDGLSNSQEFGSSPKYGVVVALLLASVMAATTLIKGARLGKPVLVNTPELVAPHSSKAPRNMTTRQPVPQRDEATGHQGSGNTLIENADKAVDLSADIYNLPQHEDTSDI